MGNYRVKLVRGPFLDLEPHPRHCDSDQGFLEFASELRSTQPQVPLVADLFSGAGGLSLGLSDAGFQVVMAADHYREAVETHRHHFPGLTVDWDLARPDVIEHVARLLKEAEVDLLTGGPPCQPFSKAGRSGIRYRVHNGMRDPHDQRRDLWRSFIEIARLARPRALLMENVPDMALDKEMFILRSIVEELEEIGYAVQERVVETWRYGVPQFRQRLILVALRDGIQFQWPEEATDRVSVWNAIGELPEVDGGWRPDGGAHGWIEYDGPETEFQKRMRSGVTSDDQKKLFDHITRPVREDDARAFELMDPSTKYSDLPEEVKRYREDIFNDKYKRLDENDLSRTITAHIAKDGYWYIHPRQGRTITVREAARLQTFPDWYRFAGPPSAAFKQIGNAVPPRLAQHLGEAINASLAADVQAGYDSRSLAALLSGWFESRSQLSLPWLRANTRWQVTSAEFLLDRADTNQIRMLWPTLRLWESPEATLGARAPLEQIGKLIGREKKVDGLLNLAVSLTRVTPKKSSSDPDAKAPEAIADLADLVVVDDEKAEEPVLVSKGVLRPVSRFFDEPVDRKNRLTDGRLGVARLVGGGENARSAHLGLIELANSLCRPVNPICDECPLTAHCRSSKAGEQELTRLF